MMREGSEKKDRPNEKSKKKIRVDRSVEFPGKEFSKSIRQLRYVSDNSKTAEGKYSLRKR